VNLAELRRELTQYEDKDGKTFVMQAPADPAPRSPWEPIWKLLRGSLAARTLALTEVTFPPATVTEPFAYVGTGRLFPWSGTGAQAELSVTASFAVDAAGTPLLRIIATVPPGWRRLTESLSGLGLTSLAAVEWASAGFLLSSAPTTDPAFAGVVPAGVNFWGEVAEAGPFSRAGALLTTADSRTVSGPVDLGQGEMPVMTLTAARPCSTAAGGVPLEAGARIESFYKEFEEVDGKKPPSVPLGFVSIAAAVRIGSRAAKLWMPLLPGGEPMAMKLREALPLDGLAALTEIAGTTIEVPEAVPAASGLELKQLQMSVPLSVEDLSKRLSMSFDVGLTGSSWELLPGVLTLEEIGFQASVAAGLGEALAATAVVYGTVTLAGELHLLATVSVPELEVGVHLEDGTTASLTKMLAQLTGGVISPPVGDMEIVQLDFLVSARNGRFTLGAAIETNWNLDFGTYGGGKLTVLGLEGVETQVEYDGSRFAGWIRADTTIAGASSYLSASTQGGESGWELAAGLKEGEKIDLVALMKAFMYPSGDVPAPSEFELQRLEINLLELGLSIDSEGNPERFSILAGMAIAWQFSLFGVTELQLAAELDLEGKRPPALTAGEWEIEGRVGGSLSAYGLVLEVAYEFHRENSALTFAVWYGNRGIEATVARVTEKGKTRTLLTVRLGDLSLGEILEFLIGLAIPGETRRLPSPWDFLYKIDFRDLKLTVDLDTHEVSLEYPVELKLGFASIDKVGLLYRTDSGEGKVLVQVTGEFLGLPYGTEEGTEPVTWDVIGEEAPPVPGKGDGKIEIRYVGLGQHVALPVPDEKLKTVEDAIAALKESMGPPGGGGNPLGGKATAGLRYDATSKWLFGLEAELIGTVRLAAVLYDPHLYGALLELSGERAGSLAGLRAELVYRRITDQIGEFSVDLQVPDRFRNWEFGEVSVTLGLIHVDVYTNGNFRVDVGFPANGDFARAFTVQVFPFIGRGGFYFAYLTGATSERVPRIRNGSFDPVIEAGVGLSIGVGKEIHKGPLSAGLSLEVEAIFEGVYAPFHPFEASVPEGTYFWFQGTAEIIGKLYGSVDFAIVKASISVVARARATVTLEAHRATHVDLELEVTAKASIKILFVTVHFSFEMHLDAGFTLGEDTQAPWIEEPAPSPRALLAGANVEGLFAAPAPLSLRQQRSQAPRRRLTAAAHLAQLPAQTHFPAWQPLPVTPATAALQFLPGFTVAEKGSANKVQVMLMLGAEAAIAPGASSAEEVREVATEHLHVVDGSGDPAFTAIVKTFLRWAGKAGAGVSGDEKITAAQLVQISEALHDPDFVASTFAYENLAAFLKGSLTLDLLGVPAGTQKPAETSTAFAPMVPAITATVKQGTNQEVRDYASYRAVSDKYAANLAAYFEQLTTDFLAAEAVDPLAAPPTGADLAAVGGTGTKSVAEALFGQYFALLTRTAVQAAIDHLAAMPYAYPATAGPSLSELAREFETVPVVVPLRKGQTPAEAAAVHGLDPTAAAGAETEGAGEERATVELQVGPTALGIAEDNQAAKLAAVSFTATGLTYQVRSGQTLNALAAAIPQQVASAGQTPGPLSAAAIAAANHLQKGFLRPGATVKIPAYEYTRVDGESDEFLEAFFAVRDGSAKRPENVDWYAQAISRLNGDAADWAAGTKIAVPSGYLRDATSIPYTVHPGDTLESIATTFALYQSTPPPSPNATGTPPPTFPVTERPHTVTSTDTFASLAAAFPGLGETALIEANLGADVLNPLAVAALPPFGVAVELGQTLAELAAALDLALPALVPLLRDVPALFLGGEDVEPLTIREVPAARVESLVSAVGGKGNEIAAQVSRFLLHGLGVPSPEDGSFTRLTEKEVLEGRFTGPLEGLYKAAGLQFEWLDLSKPVEIQLSSGASWLKLFRTKIEGGKVVSETEVTELTTTVANAAPWLDWLPATTLELEAEASALPLTEEHGVQFELQAAIHWQAAEHPGLGGIAPDASPGEPSIWLLPGSLRRRASESEVRPTPDYQLRSLPLTAPAGSEGGQVDPDRYAWGVHVPFTVRRVAAPPPPGSDPAGTPGGEWLPTTYVIDAVDQAGEDVLFALSTHLASGGSAEDGTQLQLLYEPSPAGANPGGLASGALSGTPPYILKTNLATETRRPSVAAERAPDVTTPPEVFSASLGSPAAFTEFLWEATTVLAGGFYLRYEVDGKGLPDSAFDGSGRATLTLLCLLGSQAAASLGRGLYPFNTCAVVTESIDAAATQLYAVQTGGTPPLTAVATVPPGNVGFSIDRDPHPRAGESEAEKRTQLLYNLFGYRPLAKGGFNAGNAGMPVGPRLPEGGADKWHYEQVIPAARLATDKQRVPQSCLALPAARRDPYAGVAADGTLTVGLAVRDSFGNGAVATSAPGGVSLPVRYTDPLIGVGEWPGIALSYQVVPGAAEGASPTLAIALALQASAYLPAPGLGTAPALRAASAHALRYERVIYQLRRPGVTIGATTTLAAGGQPLPLSRSHFAGFAAGAYAFASQLAGLEPVRSATETGDTLDAMARRFSVTPAALLAANAEIEPAALFAGEVAAPKFLQVRVGESVNAFAKRAGDKDAVELLKDPANAGATVPAATSVAVTAVSIPADGVKTIAEMAADAGCRPADIGTANETAAGLLADGIAWRVGSATAISSGSTFKALVEDFAAAGVKTTAAEISTANADLARVFNAGTGAVPVTYVVDRYSVPEATAVTRLVGEKFAAGFDSFVELNGDTPGVIEANALLWTETRRLPAPSSTPLRAWLAGTLGISVAAFAGANTGTFSPALKPAVELLLPALLDPGALTAVPYAFAPGQSLAAVATLFGTDAQALGASIQDIEGIFEPGAPVQVGSGPVISAGAEDSLATLRARFPAGSQPTLEQLIDAVAPSSGLLRAGAAIVCPAPVTGSATSLRALADGFEVAPVSLGRCNAALDGFLDPSAKLFWAGEDWGPVGARGTLTSLYERVAPEEDFDRFLEAVASQALLSPTAKAILPPPPALATAPLPASPAVAGTIAVLRTDVTVKRPPAEAAAPGRIAEQSSPVPALCQGQPLSYAAFAAGLEAAYGGRLKPGVGKAGIGTAERLYALRLDAPGTSGDAIRSVEVTQAPTFFALPPLCRELISRTVKVPIYQSGGATPLSEPQQRSFRAIDVQAWASSALAAIDLVLSAPYAAPAFALTRGPDGTSEAFDRLVAAKKTLAGKIAGGLTQIVPTADPQPDPVAARRSLRQSLAANLTAGWDTAAVLQLPTGVSATFSGAGEDRGGHRLAGKPLPPSRELGETVTLAGLAADFGVAVEAVAVVLGGTPNLLKEGVRLKWQDREWTVPRHGTLEQGAEALGLSLEELGLRFAPTEPLFRAGATVTLAGYSAAAVQHDTLAMLADRLASGVSFLAVCNQGVEGLLVPGTRVYVDGSFYDVTPQTTLATLALAANLPVGVLASRIAGQRVIATGATLHVVAPLPDHSLTASKIDLDTPSAHLDFLLGLANPERYRRLLLPLDFELTGLEYGIEPRAGTEYETSDWLQMVTPLTAASAPAKIVTSLGQVAVPVPLREYPVSPRLLTQTAEPAAAPRGGPLVAAKQWDYAATFEADVAAQDVVELKLGFNWTPAQGLGAQVDAPDPFRALAGFATNQGEIEADLAELLLPAEKLTPDSPEGKRAKSAVTALATIAEGLALNWGPIDPDPPPAPGEEPLVPTLELGFTLSSRVSTDAAGKQAIEALVLTRTEAAAWGPEGHEPRLGYVDKKGALVMLDPLAPDPGAEGTVLEYEPKEVLPAFGRRVFAIGYRNLDALGTQSARTALAIARNAELLPGVVTDPAFVYRTPEAHFPDVAMPALVRDAPIEIGSGAASALGPAVASLFSQLLAAGGAAASTMHELTVRFGCRLTPPGEDEEPLTALSPVVFRPLFPYDGSVPTDLTLAVQDWLQRNPTPTGTESLLSLELTVISDTLPERRHPLLNLTRLDYQLVD
jgi:LysM repeat protein